jgi:hypothetical protein
MTRFFGSHHLLLWFCEEGEWQDGKMARWQGGYFCFAFLPLYHFAIHIINKVLDGEHPYWGGYVNEC